MNLAQELLIGSARVDQWRKEINAIVSMVFGFVALEELAAFNTSLSTTIDKSKWHHWLLYNDKRVGTKLQLHRPSDRQENKDKDGEAIVWDLVWEYPGKEIPLDYVGFVHAYLDSFVEGMGKLFPDLRRRWRQLLAAGRDGFRMYYVLRFFIPSGDPFDDVRGKLLKFRKKSNLSFPLPLGTEVFVALEGNPKIPKRGTSSDSGDCFFKVVGHEHQMYDLFGDLSERQFSMILEPQEGWEDVPKKEHFPHLLEVNGWEKID